MVDYCLSPDQETLTTIYEAFITECKKQVVSNDAICSWRHEIGSSQCPENRQWSGCKTQCSVETCSIVECVEGKIENEGCFCEDGLVENHNGDCVPSAECPGENIMTFILSTFTFKAHVLQ